MKKNVKKGLIIGGVVLTVGTVTLLFIMNKKKTATGPGTATSPFPDGTFVRDATTGNIYKIENGQKRHIATLEKWNAIRGRDYTNEELNVDPAILAQIPSGPALSGLKGLGMSKSDRAYALLN